MLLLATEQKDHQSHHIIQGFRFHLSDGSEWDIGWIRYGWHSETVNIAEHEKIVGFKAKEVYSQMHQTYQSNQEVSLKLRSHQALLQGICSLADERLYHKFSLII